MIKRLPKYLKIKKECTTYRKYY